MENFSKRLRIKLYLQTKLLKYLLTLPLICFPHIVYGAGYGPISVLSSLGEPLSLEIPVELDRFESTGAVARVGSMDEYQRAGLVYGSFTAAFKARIKKNSDGNYIVLVFSREDVSVPVLDLLLNVSWSGGEIAESFTVFLDPPELLVALQKNRQLNDSGIVQEEFASEGSDKKELEMSSSDSQSSVKEDQEQGSGEGEKLLVKDDPSELSSETPTDQVKEATVGDKLLTRPVVEGDTLSTIATEIKPENISLEQMLVFLYQSNPKAFVDGNMNRLKVGPGLSIPSNVNPSDVEFKRSRQIVVEQYAKWREYKSLLAREVASTKLDQPNARQEDTGEVSLSRDEAVRANQAPKEVLKLSQDNKLEDASNSINMAQKVRELEQELIAKNNAVAEANARLERLEETIKDLKGLIELEGKAFTDVESDAKRQDADQGGVQEDEANLNEVQVNVNDSEVDLYQMIFEASIGDVFVWFELNKALGQERYDLLSSGTFSKKLLAFPFYSVLVLLAILMLFGTWILFKVKGASSESHLNRLGVPAKRPTEGKNAKNRLADNPEIGGEGKDRNLIGQRAKADFSGINLELDDNSKGQSDRGEGSKWYEVQTKFDLAKAYQEMGDRDGALQILMEVIAEGDEEQKVAAKETIAELDK